MVGLIDSGVADIPDLAGKIDGRWSFVKGVEPVANKVDDGSGHGTAVASLIAASANDGFGMAGFGGATHVISFRVDYLNDTAIAVALMKLVSLGVRIINLSIGGRTPDTPILVDAVHKAAAAGVLLVAAAGDGAEFVAYPAAGPPTARRRTKLGSLWARLLRRCAGRLLQFGTTPIARWPRNAGGCSGVLVAIPPVTEQLDQSCYSTWAGDGGARYAYLPGTSCLPRRSPAWLPWSGPRGQS